MGAMRCLLLRSGGDQGCSMGIVITAEQFPIGELSVDVDPTEVLRAKYGT